MSNKRSLIFLNIGVSLFVLFVLVRIFVFAGGDFSNTVVPRMISDDYFYYARIQEIVDGNYFFGNPFYLEHNADPNPTFVLPDWVASAPYLLGLSVVSAFAVNLFIWSLFFSSLAYCFFKILKLSSVESLVISLLLFLSSLALVMRPTIMQVIYPFFILGLMVFYYWLSDKPKKYLFFITSLFLAFTLYFYQHLAIMMYFLAGVIGLYLLFKKRFQVAFELAGAAIVSLLISIPVLKYYYALSQNKVFIELLLRIDDVFSRQPSFFVFMAGKWVAVAILLWVFVWKIFLDEQKRKVSRFFIIFGVASILASMTNVVTGVRVEIAEHIYRFQRLYISMSVFVVFVYLIKNYKQYWVEKKVFFSIAIFFLLVLLASYFSIAYKSFVGIFVPTQEIKNIQEYKVVFDELNKLSGQKVIWANEEISSLLPVYTDHYTLFARDGSAYLISNDEIQTRYMLDHSFDNEVPNFKENIGLLIGYGNEFDFYKEHNRWVSFCSRYHLFAFGLKCGQEKTTLDLVDDAFFANLQERYSKIREDYGSYLVDYQVDYLVIDRQNDDMWGDLEQLDYLFEIIYTDSRFEIYKINK